ncbi:hypothetical protein GQ61_04575 [Candidatus Nucleicultrix amoebiphila FS5]|uniref:Uncharacterized protein n=1 Tax=Candidatus Nucleicultrix amoebiphila FS5 TaxID=1414854 RepID=A0A1W6N4K6_9PROT|nr:hypothetical protein GQ61_04575 [Candidatus Nucleicultrix amoebiphila FS5]
MKESSPKNNKKTSSENVIAPILSEPRQFSVLIGNQTTSLRGPLAAAVHIAYLTGSRRFARDDALL